MRREGYRCCAHCADDPVHEVERDSHEVPCNAPNSQGCVGRIPLAHEWFCRDCGASGSLSDSIRHECAP